MTKINAKLFIVLIIPSILSLPSFAKTEIELDMASNLTSQQILLPDSGKVVVKLINLAPAKAGKYSYNLSYKYKETPGFQRPSQSSLSAKSPLPSLTNITQGLQMLAGGESAECSALRSQIDLFMKVDKETNVQAELKLLDEKIAAVAWLTSKCPQLKLAANSARDLTKDEVNFEMDSDLQVSLSVKDTSGTEPKEMKTLDVSTIESERNKWITTYGLGFVESKGQSFHSLRGDSSNYYVAQQADREDYIYSAQILFTYPIYKDWQGFQFGITGGLGASQDNISGLIGLSAIVNKNLVFTLGMNMQEHSILKGQYEVGQDVGSEPIDSDVLEDKTFKTSTAFVLSFKFE